MKLALGIMSGTSCDGVSVALAGFKGKSFELFYENTYPYPSEILKELSRRENLTVAEISRLNVTLGFFFGDCALKFLRQHKVDPASVTVIGSHGHTLYHAGDEEMPHTLQIGEASCIAERTGLPVVADFRMRDIAAGGQGAPLIPFFDEYFFGGGKTCALQNIGGIGNVTLVGKNIRTVAFDTGPGNCLIDLVVQKMTKGKQLFDRGGQIAARGKVDEDSIKRALAHSYFQQKPPKSTGRELFNEAFLARYFRAKGDNLVATLTSFTAATIHESYKKFLPSKPQTIIVSGGGALNKTLMIELSRRFAPVTVSAIEAYGLPSQAKEPVAFAFFALQAFEGKINHSPAGTGAKGERILGKITPSRPSFPALQKAEIAAPVQKELPRKAGKLSQLVMNLK